ncbi:hypothetical protein BC941DRAFT_466819 [Chlamydoabsidia padenii]|nr:hypothetical protein BC941DRAFT_466819 [Chlamydoabsidia padenii]
MQANQSFWRSCNRQKQCHCDWRLTVYDCEETEAIRWIYINNAIASAVVGAIGIGLLYYRLHYRGQHIFDTNTQTGFIRPKPIESLVLFAIIFNFLRLAHSIILVTDVLSNVAFRSFAFEFPWAFGYAALSCYVFGIAHTMVDSSHVLYNAWFHDPLRIDISCSLLIILPFVSNNICSISAGFYAQQGNIEKATLYTHALYYLWTIYCGTLAFVMLYSGTRLVVLLQHHLRVQEGTQSNVVKVKTGILKVKLVILTGFICLFVFAIIVCIYGVFRERMQSNSVCSLLIAGIWTFDGPLATLMVELALILNPHMTGVLGLVAVSSSMLTTMNDDTYSWTDTQHYTLSTSPSHKYTFDSAPYYDSIKSNSSISKNSTYYHRKSTTNDDGSCYDNGRVAPTSTSLMEARQLEQDKLHYNAITNQARIHPTRAATQKRINYTEPVIPPPVLRLSTSDRLFDTYY